MGRRSRTAMALMIRPFMPVLNSMAQRRRRRCLQRRLLARLKAMKSGTPLGIQKRSVESVKSNRPVYSFTCARFILLVALSLVLVSTTLFARDTSNADPWKAAVEKYIRYGNADLTQLERHEILNNGLLREIKNWPFEARLKSHKLFAFQNG